MTVRNVAITWLAALCSSFGAVAEATHTTNRGYSGLINIPTATLVSDGRATAAIGNDVAFLPSESYSGGFVGFAMGLHERVEMGGMLAEYRRDSGTNLPHARDLSGHIKLKLFERWGCAASAGITDFAGEVIFFRSKYAVGSCRVSESVPVTLTAGIAVADGGAIRPLLDGVFGGVEWQPNEHFSLMVEDDSRGINTGFKLSSGSWLPFGDVHLLAKADSTTDGYDPSVALGINLALGRKDWTPKQRLLKLPLVDDNSDPEFSRALVAELSDAGLQDIAVAVDTVASRVWVRYQNEAYQHSQIDGLGVVLAIAAKRLSGRDYTDVTAITYVASEPVLSTDVNIDDYVQFLETGEKAKSLNVEFAQRDEIQALDWRSSSSSRGRVFIELSPDIVNFAGNEAGAYSQATAMRVGLMADLGYGFRVDSAFLMPLHHSGNFDDGEAFASSRQDSGFQQLSMQYHRRLHSNIANLTTLGLRRINGEDVSVAFNETVANDNSGLNALRLNLAKFEGDTIESTVATLSYTRHILSVDSSVSLKYGDFFFGDRGAEFRVNRYVGDTIIGMFFRYVDEFTQSGGLSISLPLSPRRGMNPGGLTVRGTNRWGYAMTTSINDPRPGNPINQSIVVEPATRYSLIQDYSDAGRLVPAYVMKHAQRMRVAYWELVAEVD